MGLQFLAFIFLLSLLSACVAREHPQSPKCEKLMRKPVIGINTSIEHTEGRESACVRLTYVDAVAKGGGIPFVLPALEEVDSAAEYVEKCDGLIFIGGGDISSKRYGKTPHPMENPLPARREEFDFALIRETLAAKKPFLAICLGCQEVNVALGGTLIQDIATQVETPIRHSTQQPGERLRHRVNVADGSLLHHILGTTEVETNSSHHQAIETPGNGLSVVAWADDGVIEACELTDYPFGLCVQWHPEALLDEPAHFAIFRAFVDAATQK
ncbi:MAG: gamma-glutamyl-gamma-aminobutyrate hydrolase family protein [Candidatus Sumerlaeaceae bacterium]